jgi:cytidine deaminase
MNLEDIEMAKKARENAYVPYSNFKVGALLRCKNGKVFAGCNVENHGIQSICAERVAFTKAISEGEKEFESITVIGAKEDESPTSECLPCGYCRQFMSEFVDKDFKIYTVENENVTNEYTIKDLLPYSFSL